MIDPSKFFELLKNLEIEFFTGVPDSLLKNFCAYVEENCLPDKHIISANEGNAIGLAAGYHLATKKIPLVYMQNSGLGNCVNPLTSLTDEEVYSIPMLLLIGWRGEPNVKDEPQHIKQGRITESLLQLLDIDYLVLNENSDSSHVLNSAVAKIKEKHSPVAILVKSGTFSKYELKNKENNFHIKHKEIF